MAEKNANGNPITTEYVNDHKEEHKEEHNGDRLELAAKREADRVKQGLENPEPSLGSRLGQVGMLGWLLVLPALFGLWVGRKIDEMFATGILFSAPFLILGVLSGFWFIWSWMHKQ